MNGTQEKEWMMGWAIGVGILASIGLYRYCYTFSRTHFRNLLLFFIGFTSIWVMYLVTGDPSSPAHNFLFEVLEMVWVAGIVLPILWQRGGNGNPAGT